MRSEKGKLGTRERVSLFRSMQKALTTGVNSQIEGLDLVIARPFPHTGPSQSEQFVCSDWARQIAAIEAGKKPPCVEVGNLEVVTDYCDVQRFR